MVNIVRGGTSVISIGVALGGGGVRGMAHIGVLKELQSMGITINHIAGTSAGAIVAALYAAGVDWELVEKKVRCIHWHHLFEWNYLWRRQMESRKLLNHLLELLGEDKPIESLPVKLSVTAVELLSGTSVVLNKGSLIEAVKASIALPGFFKAVKNSQGGILVDGGVLGNVPVIPLKEAGCDCVVAVDVRNGVGNLNYKELNSKIKLIFRIGEVMNHYITDKDLSQADLIIKPDVAGVGTLEMKKMSYCIEAGKKAVMDMRDQIGTLLQKKSLTLPLKPETKSLANSSLLT